MVLGVFELRDDVWLRMRGSDKLVIKFSEIQSMLGRLHPCRLIKVKYNSIKKVKIS